MKKVISTLVVFLASVSMASAAQYLQASSTITQCPGKAPEIVKMDITDAANGLARLAARVEDPLAVSIYGCVSMGRM